MIFLRISWFLFGLAAILSLFAIASFPGSLLEVIPRFVLAAWVALVAILSVLAPHNQEGGSRS